ncbi:hypothetical protein IMX26_10150 [Clostridium sp. 'deep sea']|uniref:hypothetical protein n=1 Tax=Clostridium sp. 'deep sea' TaxID=2779445 RepID=UPI001896692F|nr:hypothetical protein [Clostridium sp. 'deep sea']QOR33859.1 hypothetical protein IMX26_10150 [Clostridium sp. 'deep sea']
MNRSNVRSKLNVEQLRSFSIYNFLILFSELERVVKDEFARSLRNIDKERYSKISFYIGGIKSNNTYLDYVEKGLMKPLVKYSEKKIRNGFTFNNIVKFDRSEKVIPKFNFTVKSLTRKMVEYEFHDCCIKFIRMRNKLAHEINCAVFKEECYIEQLNSTYIQIKCLPFLENIDISNIDQGCEAILTNCIFIKSIINTLNREA